MAEEFRRDVGSGEQLDAGEATGLNQELDFGEEVAAQLEANSLVGEQPPLDTSVEYTDEDPVYEPGDDLEKVLFGPTEGLAGAHVSPSKKPIPRSVLRMLPTLMLLVDNPNTPPALKASYRLIIQRLEDEMVNA